LEYNPDTQEIIDRKTGNIWAVMKRPIGHKYTHVNQIGYEIMDAYDNRFCHPDDNIIKYIPDPAIPLEPDERREMGAKIRGLTLQEEDAWEKLFRDAEKRINLNAKLLKIEIESKRGVHQDSKDLMQMVRDYLNRYL